MENERVSYSFGMKVNLGNYQSADFHVSLSSDVQSNETSVTAYNRVKKEVETFAELAYQEILAKQSGDKKDVPTPAEPKKEAPKAAPIGVLKQQIKAAFGVLQAQKKIDAAGFKTKYLSNKKTDDLNELEVTKAIVALREDFKELKI